MDQQIAVERRGRALAELTPYHHPHAEVFLSNELPVEVVAVDPSRSERGVEEETADFTDQKRILRIDLF